MQLDTCGGLHVVVLLGPAGAEPPRGFAHGSSVQLVQDSICLGADDLGLRADGNAASGSPPWARIMARQTSIARPEASTWTGS